MMLFLPELVFILRLMGFNAIEDRFSSKEEVFTVSDAQAFRQLGNAVVPEIVEEIGREILRTIEKH